MFRSRCSSLFWLALPLLMLAASCGGDPARDDSGAILEGGDLSVFSIREGDCFDDGDLTAEELVEVAAVPCAEPHDNEVYAVFDIANQDETFPGDDSLAARANEACYQLFEDFVGIAYEDSALDFFPITPTKAGWEDGDREVICAVYDLDFAKLTGSMRDSGF
jgi:hypothetical protein